MFTSCLELYIVSELIDDHAVIWAPKEETSRKVYFTCVESGKVVEPFKVTAARSKAFRQKISVINKSFEGSSTA